MNEGLARLLDGRSEGLIEVISLPFPGPQRRMVRSISYYGKCSGWNSNLAPTDYKSECSPLHQPDRSSGWDWSAIMNCFGRCSVFMTPGRNCHALLAEHEYSSWLSFAVAESTNVPTNGKIHSIINRKA